MRVQWKKLLHFWESESSNIGTDRAPFLRGREGAGGGAHILRGRTFFRISCPDWSYSVRTPRDVCYSCALIGQTAYVHPVTYAIAGRTLIRISCPDWSKSVRTHRDVRYSRALFLTLSAFFQQQDAC